MLMIGTRIKALMKKSGATQAQVAAAVRVSQPAVSGWFKGASPDADKIAALAAFFDVSVGYLLGTAAECPENIPAIFPSPEAALASVRSVSSPEIKPSKNCKISEGGIDRKAEIREALRAARATVTKLEQLLDDEM